MKSIFSELRLRVGVNALSNRFWFLNDKIDLNYLSLSFDTFKIKMKELFITTWTPDETINKKIQIENYNII